MKALKISLSILTTVAAILNCDAASYTVTTTNDTGPNSLRAVITTANGVAGPHTITFGNTGHFGGGGTINLVSALPQITQSVTIAGWRNPGATNNAVTVTGSSFVFESGTSNSLQQLNIAGSITNGQSISITGCVITNGGIQSTGVLQIISSSVVASPTAGVWSSGNATLNGVTVSQCSDGGIHNEGTMAIADSLVYANSRPGNGGGIYTANSLRVVGCDIADNSTSAGCGGGVFNSGTAFFTQTTIRNNVSDLALGGGICDEGRLTLVDSLISQNTAAGQNGSSGGGGGGALGGGIYLNGISVTATNTTFSGNRATGGAAGIGFGGNGGGPYGGTGGANGVNSSTPGGNGLGGGSLSGGGAGGAGYPGRSAYTQYNANRCVLGGTQPQQTLSCVTHNIAI